MEASTSRSFVSLKDRIKLWTKPRAPGIEPQQNKYAYTRAWAGIHLLISTHSRDREKGRKRQRRFRVRDKVRDRERDRQSKQRKRIIGDRVL